MEQQWQWYHYQQAIQQQQYYQWYHQNQMNQMSSNNNQMVSNQMVNNQMVPNHNQMVNNHMVPNRNQMIPNNNRMVSNNQTNHKKNKRPREITSNHQKPKKRQLDLDIPEKYLVAHSIGTSPEEVAQWRAERRKHYPTAAKSAQGVKPSEDANKDKCEIKPGTKSPVCETKRKKPCFKFSKGNCKFGDKCNYSHDPESKNEISINKRKETEKKNHSTNTGKESLLRKLLMSDINKERSVVLECIRHLLSNKM